MKDFTEQLNDLIAPVTRAWVDPEITYIVVGPGEIEEETIDALVTVKVKLRKRDDCLYSIAKHVTLDHGFDYTDPRTGEVTKAPKKAEENEKDPS